MLYDPATVEACAKVAEGTAPIARGNFFKARREQTAKIASAIRSLTAGREIQSSDGGAKVASSAVLASEEDQRSGLHGVMPVGTIAASSGNTDAGPSEAIQSGYADYTPVTVRAHTVPNSAGGLSSSHCGPSAGESDPVVKQDSAPGTVSEEASEPYGWFEPITPELGGSLVERFRKGAEKPFNWSEFAFPLFRLRRMR